MRERRYSVLNCGEPSDPDAEMCVERETDTGSVSSCGASTAPHTRQKRQWRVFCRYLHLLLQTFI